jgi:hypothetical protein
LRAKVSDGGVRFGFLGAGVLFCMVQTPLSETKRRLEATPPSVAQTIPSEIFSKCLWVS